MTSAPHLAPTDAPLIVTALMGADDFGHFDALRRAHFPLERNFVPAHITLFHHLPPARLPELTQLLRTIAKDAAPRAWLADILFMGRGNGVRVESDELLDIRARIAEWFAADLIVQDQQTPRLHITIQNKVAPNVAKALHAELVAQFRPRALTINGLAIWSYRGGPWDLIRKFAFRGARS
jgi:hypothetical protein